MKRKIFFLLSLIFITSAIFANPMLNEPSIHIQNRVLVHVNGSPISVVDVMKKMDVIFHKTYPQLENSPGAKYQFYSTGWKNILNEMINIELVLADANSRDNPIVTDGEIKEELENRFGPNVLSTIENIGLSYQEAWDFTKKEMIVMRMTWFFINNKAIQSVTPQLIRQTYHAYCKENPPLKQWQYQIISIRGDDKKLNEKISQEIYSQINAEKSTTFTEIIQNMENQYSSISIQLSPTYNVNNKEISQSHLDILANLTPNSVSSPVAQTSRSNNKPIYRIFYLKEFTEDQLPSFEEKADELKNYLIHNEIVKASEKYYTKLRKRYGFEEKQVKEMIPDDFTPFILK